MWGVCSVQSCFCILTFKALSTGCVLTSRKWSKEGHQCTDLPPLQDQESIRGCLVKIVIKEFGRRDVTGDGTELLTLGYPQALQCTGPSCREHS